MELIQKIKNTGDRKSGKKIYYAAAHRKITAALWILFGFGFLFAVYKNFTAIDRHTVHEKEIIKQEIVDTNRIENFTLEFAQCFYSWGNTMESLEERKKGLVQYMAKDLLELAGAGVSDQIPTQSAVRSVKITGVQEAEGDFNVAYTVVQDITESVMAVDQPEPGVEQRTVTSAYMVTVRPDQSGNPLIVRSPSPVKLPEKSEDIPKRPESDGTVKSGTANDIQEFLKTFLRVYPTASANELSYYVKNSAVEPLNQKRYIFSELRSPVFRTEDGKTVVYFTAEFLDADTKQSHYAQYTFILEKTENWFIVGSR